MTQTVTTTVTTTVTNTVNYTNTINVTRTINMTETGSGSIVGAVTNSSSVSNTSSLSSASTNSTGGNVAPAACSFLTNTALNEGLSLKSYFPPTAKAGQTICIYTLLQNDNASTISSISGNVTITNATGAIVFQNTLVPFEAGSVRLPLGQALSFSYLWNTIRRIRGTRLDREPIPSP